MFTLKRKVVRAYIHDKNDERILLIKSFISKNYSLPGGRVEEHEELEDALLRELKEELGIKRDSIERVEKRKHVVSKTRLFLLPLESEIWFFDVFLKQEISLKLSIESRVIQWIKIPEHKRILAQYEANPF